jgi:hypothetical protein
VQNVENGIINFLIIQLTELPLGSFREPFIELVDMKIRLQEKIYKPIAILRCWFSSSIKASLKTPKTLFINDFSSNAILWVLIVERNCNPVSLKDGLFVSITKSLGNICINLEEEINTQSVSFICVNKLSGDIITAGLTFEV